MAEPYDLIALGSGSAATGVATRCRSAGWRVAMVEARELGGTCPLRGCEPKKVLWTVANVLDRAQRFGRAGLKGTESTAIDWPALMAFEASFTEPVPGHRAESFAERGIEVLYGHGRFATPSAISVDGRTMEARHMLIATGAKPKTLPIEGFDLLATSDDFLKLPTLPKEILLIGGGYIAFEFAHIAAQAGARVTILNDDDRPLAAFDPDLVTRLVDWTRRLGVGVELNARVSRIARLGDGVGTRIIAEVADGRRFDADLAVHGLGRVPDLDGLDLAAGSVAAEHGRLRLDPHLRSITNPRVFAAGDVAAVGPPLTPVATADAACVAANLLGDPVHQPDHGGVASTVFTIPPLAMTGLTEDQARAQGRDFEIRRGDLSNYHAIRREGLSHAGTAFKILLERHSGRILGAHLFAPFAHETINLFALAVRTGLPAAELAALPAAYPSSTSTVASMLG